MFCSKCGAENADGAKFCAKCGTPLEGLTKVRTDAKSEPSRKRIGLGMLIGGILLFIIGAAGAPLPLMIIGLVVTFLGGYFTWTARIKARQEEIKELDVITVTTDTIPGKRIVKTLGLVEAHTAWNATDDVLAEMDARKNLMREARRLGANAIVGLKSERRGKGSNTRYYMHGTAVTAEDGD